MPTPPKSVSQWLKDTDADTIVDRLVQIDPKKAAAVGMALYMRGASTVGSTGDEIVRKIKEDPKGAAGRAAMGALQALFGGK